MLSRNSKSGFTLIEILAVTLILGVLAAVVIPQVGSASKESREAVLRSELKFLREQLSLYANAHEHPAGFDAMLGTYSQATLVAQMIGITDYAGQISNQRTSEFRFGPYLSRIPDSPISGKMDFIIVEGDDPIPAPDDSTGWIYKPKTLELYANSTIYGPGGKNW